MSTLHLRESMLIRRSAADVFAYVADVDRGPEWRAGVVSASSSPGPLRSGSIVYEVADIAGHRVRTEYVVELSDAPHRLGLRYRAGPVPVSVEYAVTKADGGAVLHFDLTVDLHGGWALLTPVLRLSAPSMMVESLDELRFRLEASVLPLAS